MLASNVGAISEMFVDGKSGLLFESNNADKLRDCLKLLNQNESLIDAISKQARLEAQSKYHPDLVATNTIHFYHQVLSRKNKAK